MGCARSRSLAFRVGVEKGLQQDIPGAARTVAELAGADAIAVFGKQHREVEDTPQFQQASKLVPHEVECADETEALLTSAFITVKIR